MRETMSLVAALFATCAVLYGCYLFTRMTAKRLSPGGGRRSGRMKTLDYMPLGTDKSLAIVQIGERYFLIGVSSGEINLLTELSPEDVSLPQEEADAAARKGFSIELIRSMEKYRRKKEDE